MGRKLSKEPQASMSRTANRRSGSSSGTTGRARTRGPSSASGGLVWRDGATKALGGSGGFPVGRNSDQKRNPKGFLFCFSQSVFTDPRNKRNEFPPKIRGEPNQTSKWMKVSPFQWKWRFWGWKFPNNQKMLKLASGLWLCLGVDPCFSWNTD